MGADYRINLAKELTSTEEDRARFYNGMLIYLVTCAALMVFVAYYASVNIKSFLENKSEERQLIRTTTTVSGLDKGVFKNPSLTYDELEAYSFQIASLKRALERRVQLLPVVHNLFTDLPENVVLQSLSANKEKVSFGLVMPPASADAGDPVKTLRSAWEKNAELMERVASIRPVTGERRTMNGESMFFVQFECVLKK